MICERPGPRRSCSHGRSVLVLVGDAFGWRGWSTGVIQQGWLRQPGNRQARTRVRRGGSRRRSCLHRSQFELFTHKDSSWRGPTKVLFECLAWCSAVVFICLSIPALYYAITQGGSISAYTETRSPVLEAFWNIRIPWIGLVLGLLFFSYPNGTGFMSRLLCMVAARLDRTRRASASISSTSTVLQVFVTFDLSATTKLMLALIFSVGVASLLFMMLEAPMISLGQKLSTRLRPEVGNERLDFTGSA